MKKKIIPINDHSKAIIVGLAYLIGFTTAYIAFGINESKVHSVVKSNYESRHSVVNQAAAFGAAKTFANEEGLFIRNGEEERIISATSDGEELEFGFHKEIVTTSMSMDQSMVHYCATMDDSEECYNFVYVVSEDVVYPVRDSNGVVVTSMDEAQTSAWLPGNLLSINGEVSLSTTNPWLMP